MMMMADGLLGPCTDQVIEGVTVGVDSDTEQDDDAHGSAMSNGYSIGQENHHDSSCDYETSIEEEIIETVSVPHLFSTTSAACANCSMSFFDPIGNPVHSPIFYMCLDSASNEAIQISSVIHILFAKKLSRCPKPSSDLALCNKCADLVAKMYQLYRELDSLSAMNSYINSFPGEINQIFLPNPDSSSLNSSVNYNYANYEDSITAAISGPTDSSSFASTPEVAAGTTITNNQSNFNGSQREQKPLPLPEPPPLTLPSYYGTPRSNLFSAQDLLDKKVFAHEIGLTQQIIKPRMEIDELLNSIALSNTSSHIAAHSQYGIQIQQQPVQQQPVQQHSVQQQSVQQLMQAQPLQQETVKEEQLIPQPKTPKRKKIKQEPTDQGQMAGDQRSLENETIVRNVDSLPSNETAAPDEKKRRQVNCPEEGCTKVYRGRGARASLRQHIKIHHLKEFPFQCTVCLKPIATRVALDIHLRTHMNVEERAALNQTSSTPAPPRPPPPSEPLPSKPCPECGKVFQTEYILSLHIKNHQDRDPILYKCEHENCSKEFRDKSSLRRHEHRHFNPTTPTMDYGCSRCSKRFESRKLLREHQSNCEASVVSTARQFSCNFGDSNCKRTFKYKHHLQNHLMFQHKLTPEEARQEVYPGLSVKDWMTSPKRNQRSPMKHSDSTVKQEPTPSLNHEAVQPFPSSIQFQPPLLPNPTLNDLRSLPSPAITINTASYDQPQLVINQSQDGYSYIQYQNQGLVNHQQNQDMSFLFQQNMLGMGKSVIQETGNAVAAEVNQKHYHHLQNAFQSLPTVIQQNPSVIQQNPILFQNTRPPSSSLQQNNEIENLKQENDTFIMGV